METDVKRIRIAAAQAKEKGHDRLWYHCVHGRYSNDRDEQQKLEQAIDDLGYDFEWEETYDNHGISWATWLVFKLR